MHAISEAFHNFADSDSLQQTPCRAPQFSRPDIMRTSDSEKSKEALLREIKVLRERVAVLESAQAHTGAVGWIDDLFYSLVDSVEEYAIFMLDSSGFVTTWNRGAQRLLGYSADEILGRHFSCFYTDADIAASLPAEDLRLARVDGRHSGDIWRVRKGGCRFLANFVTTALRDSNQEIYGFARVLRDVTEQELAKHEIAQLHADLERRVADRTAELTATNEELAAFSYSVSHDLRAPLRAIDGFSQAVLEDYGLTLDSAGAGYLRRIRGEAQRMGELIDSLLDLSRITRTELMRQPVNLSEIVQQVTQRLQQSDPHRQVEFAIATGLWARGDERMLGIALENLLENAWKFTSLRATARIEFGVAEQDGHQEVWYVKDNGVGFDMAYAGELFGAFQRLHPETEFPGTGIGLATVQRIIHRHGGRTWAEAIPDQGATFFFTL